MNEPAFSPDEIAELPKQASATRRAASLLRRPLVVAALAALWIATLGNAALWRALSRLSLLDGAGGTAFGAAVAAMLAGAFFAVMALLAWRWTLKPAIVFLLFAAAIGAHFMWTYGVMLDRTMMVNVLQTDLREARELADPRLAAVLLLGAVLPAVLLWRLPLAYGAWPRRTGANALGALAGSLLFAAAALAAFQPLASAMRNHRELRYLVNPANSIVALARVAAGSERHAAVPMQAIGEDARIGGGGPNGKPPLLVLVLGETARSGNFGLNGYARDTTPELARLPVASFRDAWSCGTSTAASLPCMFSGLGRAGFDRLRTPREGLLDVLSHAGLGVLWVDNQAGCKGVCDRVPSASTAASASPALCHDGECLDEILLEGLDERIAALPAERRAAGVVVVLHTMGSHGPAYSKRSPAAFKRFAPECESASLERCSVDQVVNAYDNTIAYTDHFLAATIGWLAARDGAWDGAMVYVSDHGESLGENNLFLHGLPYSLAPDVQKRVPWITWFSKGFAERSGVDLECLRRRADAAVSHDDYFDSVLGLMDVRTRVRRVENDVYAPCRPAARRRPVPDG